MEIALAQQLKAAGVLAQITCLDFNPTLIRHASIAAKAAGVSAVISFETRDCNQPFELEPQDIVIVNQFFHHVTALEVFCKSLQRTLAPKGALLTSDIIGRNGHQLWPVVEAVVQQAWAKLPTEQRYDRHFGTLQPSYRPIDHSAYSNEGVRAQDIVGCLLGEFDFELFFSFGGAIVPFIERRVGFNFDPDDPHDREFIDEVQATDAAALAAGKYPAANMIAVLRQKGAASELVYLPVSPQQHVELTRHQQTKLELRRSGAEKRG
ncbi:MAG: class I SAM-dependent methyltransferase [Rhodanobacter sp.]